MSELEFDYINGIQKLNYTSTAYVQPIFCPNDEMFERQLKSIKSWVDYSLLYGYHICNTNTNPSLDAKPYLGGYCAKDSYWNDIEDALKPLYNDDPCTNHKHDKRPIVYRFNKNYGKAIIVNKIVDIINAEESSNIRLYIFTSDSDIIYDIDEPDILRRFIYCAKNIKINSKKEFGVIAANQKEHSCHVYDFINQNTHKYPLADLKIIEEYGYPNGVPQGIAGGSLFINLKAFNKIGKYPVLGVYGGDDGYLLLNMYNNKYPCVCLKSLNVIHPFETNGKYKEWKVNQIHKLQRGIRIPLNDSVNETENFWKTL